MIDGGQIFVDLFFSVVVFGTIGGSDDAPLSLSDDSSLRPASS